MSLCVVGFAMVLASQAVLGDLKKCVFSTQRNRHFCAYCTSRKICAKRCAVFRHRIRSRKNATHLQTTGQFHNRLLIPSSHISPARHVHSCPPSAYTPLPIQGLCVPSRPTRAGACAVPKDRHVWVLWGRAFLRTCAQARPLVRDDLRAHRNHLRCSA